MAMTMNVAHSSGPNPSSNPAPGDLWNDDVSGSMYVYTQNGWVDTAINAIVNTANVPVASISSSGNLSIGTGTQQYAFHQPTTSVIAIETKVGRVGINIETGDITVPQGIGRDEAIREFWFGFQKHFQPMNKVEYERKIKDLEQKVEIAYKVSTKETAKHFAEKIRKKYGNEKFIMIKPEDLIKFIEEA